MRWPPLVLVAEDNDDEFVLLRCAFESAGLPHRLVGVSNGAEALDYLYAEEEYSNRAAFPFPDLMLLDLHMPLVGGLEVLACVSGRIEFRNLPIVVLSSEDDPTVIRTARRLGAKDYIIKPMAMADRVQMVRDLHFRLLAGREKPVFEGRRFNPWGARIPPAEKRPKRKAGH